MLPAGPTDLERSLMKKCPFCAEEIQDDAVKCRHCGEMMFKGDQSKAKCLEIKGNERTIAMWCHLITLVGFVMPFGNFLGPLIIWLLKKDEYPLVDDQGRESLNFQITIFIYTLISGILMFLLVGFLLIVVVGLFALIQVIIASMSASNGQRYRYPLCIRFINPPQEKEEKDVPEQSEPAQPGQDQGA